MAVTSVLSKTARLIVSSTLKPVLISSNKLNINGLILARTFCNTNTTQFNYELPPAKSENNALKKSKKALKADMKKSKPSSTTKTSKSKISSETRFEIEKKKCEHELNIIKANLEVIENECMSICEIQISKKTKVKPVNDVISNIRSLLSDIKQKTTLLKNKKESIDIITNVIKDNESLVEKYRLETKNKIKKGKPRQFSKREDKIMLNSVKVHGAKPLTLEGLAMLFDRSFEVVRNRIQLLTSKSGQRSTRYEDEVLIQYALKVV